MQKFTTKKNCFFLGLAGLSLFFFNEMQCPYWPEQIDELKRTGQLASEIAKIETEIAGLRSNLARLREESISGKCVSDQISQCQYQLLDKLRDYGQLREALPSDTAESDPSRGF